MRCDSFKLIINQYLKKITPILQIPGNGKYDVQAQRGFIRNNLTYANSYSRQGPNSPKTQIYGVLAGIFAK